MKKYRSKGMKQAVVARCQAFELSRVAKGVNLDAMLLEAVEVCRDVLAAFDSINAALDYMPGDSPKLGLKSAFIYASTMPHEAYDRTASAFFHSSLNTDPDPWLEDLIGGVGYEGLTIPRLWSDDLKPFCSVGFYQRLFPEATKAQAHAIVNQNIHDMSKFVSHHEVRGGESNDNFWVFSAMISSGMAGRIVIAECLLSMRTPAEDPVWLDFLPWLQPDHLGKLIDEGANTYRSAEEIVAISNYFQSFLGLRERFFREGDFGGSQFGPYFSNRVREHFTGESYGRVITPWPRDEHGLNARKAYCSWGLIHDPELLEMLIRCLDLFEKKYRGREVSELLKLVHEDTPVAERSNQDLWIEAVLSQMSMASIIEGQALTAQELSRLEVMSDL